MRDEHATREHTAACQASQEVFNALAALYRQQCKAVEKAVADRDQTGRAMAEQVENISVHTRALMDVDAPVPIAIKDADFYRAFVRGMEAGELHAELEFLAAEQGFGPDARHKAA